MIQSGHRISTYLAATLAVAVLLTGCASAPRTAETDQGIKRVAIVSMLQENAPVVHLGLTVFNNDRKTVDQDGALNRLAVDVVAQRVRAARPGWTVVPVALDPAMVKKSNGAIPWTSFTGSVKEDLQRIARDADADLVFAVVDATRENSPGRGVGISTRVLTRDSAGSALVHAHVLLVLASRDGTEITNRGGPDAHMPATDLGLNYDLSSLEDPQVRDRVSTALRKQLGIALTEAATNMGY